mmetsp:Transcript_28176/g.42648  ORF Transcript_28176/g.42648 Transcript_28176/m.42648 type:complete len:116 (-) Transcript_28176:284-631(-)
MTVPLTTCCCSDQGTGNLKVSFNKNVFFSNEVATASVAVDNSKSQLFVKSVEFRVIQNLKIEHYHHTFDVLGSIDESGIEAEKEEVDTKIMQLNLADIRYDVEPQKKKKRGIFEG